MREWRYAMYMRTRNKGEKGENKKEENDKCSELQF